MYNSKYYTCEQVDQRLLQGYYDDAVAAGYTGSKAQYLAGLLKAINYSANPTLTADKVVYDPAISGLTSKNVKAALDELVDEFKQVVFLGDPEEDQKPLPQPEDITRANLATKAIQDDEGNSIKETYATNENLGITKYPHFNVTNKYSKGTTVYFDHDRKLYKFTVDHEPGAWNPSQVVKIDHISASMSTYVVQESGEAEDKVMSQKATTTAITDETTRAKAAEEAIVFDVSVYNNGAVFESIKALLSSSNLNTLIPTSARRGGMAIRFIQSYEQSSDNKYVQYRLMADSWSTTPSDWQGVDDEPTAGSDNLVKSGGVYEEIIKTSCGKKIFTTSISDIYTSIPILEGKFIVKIVSESTINNVILALNETGSASGTTTYIVNNGTIKEGASYYIVDFNNEPYLRAYSGSTYPSGLSFEIYTLVYENIENLTETADNYVEKHTNAETTASLSAEILPQTEWTKGSGWSGDLANGYTHQEGSSGTKISQGTSNLGTSYYLVSLKVKSPVTTKDGCSGFTISIGGSIGFEMYEGNFSEHIYYRGIKAAGSSGILIKATSKSFVGTISDISLKRIEGNTNGYHKIFDESNNLVLEMKGTIADESVFLGRSNDNKDVGGIQNVGIGIQALENNTTGFWNEAIGYQALRDNNVGSRNVAIGYVALVKNTSGHRNIAIGSFAMVENLGGAHNIAIGADALQRNTSGEGNVAIGTTTLGNNQTHNHNIGIGYGAMLGNKAEGNIAIGKEALQYNETGFRNIVIGYDACKRNTKVMNSIVLGSETLNGTGMGELNNCIIIGSRNCQQVKSATNCILIADQTDMPDNANGYLILGDSRINTVIIANKVLSFNGDGSVTWSNRT